MSKRKPDARQLAFDFEAAREPWTLDRVAAVLESAGVPASGYSVRFHGSLHDTTAPFIPRSRSFPLDVQIVDGEVRLWMRTPAVGSLPFVQRVEAVLGVLARWDEDRRQVMHGQWLHAVDLCTDERWPELMASREHTIDLAITRAVAIHVEQGDLSLANAKEILHVLGVAEPLDRSEGFLFGPRGMRPCRTAQAPNLHGTELVHAWGIIHAFEDGWVSVPTKKNRHPRVTFKYWQRVDGPMKKAA
jgi:hypothetical protein